MSDAPNDGRDFLLRVFTRFDSDGNGLVDEAEFCQILRSLGDEPTAEVLSLEFALIDANGDGRVEFEEFAAWWLDYNDA